MTENLAAEVLQLLRRRGWSLATAESLTAGYLSGALASVPGASDVLRGAVVAYSSEVKRDVLGVPHGPVVTEATAAAMARGVARLLTSDCAVATTGVAGPDLQEGRPAGTVCLAAMTPTGSASTTVHLPGGREQVRRATVDAALILLRGLVLG